MYFEQALQRLRQQLRDEVRNGELTERGLARRAGCSQPHIHNVLKGRRILTPRTADQMLRARALQLEDLLKSADGD